MRSWQLLRPGSLDLELRETEMPGIGDDQLLVRVRAAAVNPADLVVMLGERYARFMHARSFPLTPGYDFAGIVERVGANVSPRRVGEEVFGFLPYSPGNDRGTLAEFVATNAGESYRKPTGVSFGEAAAAATCGMTALGILDFAGRIDDRRVLINGASGGVGSMLVQIAKSRGANVWGTARPENHAFLRRIGADAALDYADTDPAEIEARFQLVADLPDRWSFSRTERILRPGGAYVTTAPSMRLVRGKIASLLSPRSCHAVQVQHDADHFQELSRLLASRKVKVPIHASFSMDDAPAAFRMFRDDSIRGKVVIMVSAD